MPFTNDTISVIPLQRKRILTKPWHWLELKGKAFSLGLTSTLILIELKDISRPFKRHPEGDPLVYSPSVTWSLWSIFSTWTTYPLFNPNLISQLISIVTPTRLMELFTLKEQFANSGRKKSFAATFNSCHLAPNLLTCHTLPIVSGKVHLVQGCIKRKQTVFRFRLSFLNFTRG